MPCGCRPNPIAIVNDVVVVGAGPAVWLPAFMEVLKG